MMLQDKKHLEETIYFLKLCGEKDRGFLGIPQKNRKTEDYARLIYITLVFGFKRVCMKLVGEAGNRMNEIVEFFKEVGNDYSVTEKWIDGFIKNITNPELKSDMRKRWEEKLTKIDKDNFNINQLI